MNNLGLDRLPSQPSKWKIKCKNSIYSNNWIHLTEYEVLNPAGNEGIYGKVSFKNLAIGIIVIDDEDRIILVGQHRFPLNQYSWEIPEGGSLLHKNPIEGAKRELKEETGIEAESFELILEMHLSNSVSDEKAMIYLAKNLSYGKAEPEETEDLMRIKIPFEEAYQRTIKGEITDAMTVAAILRMKLLREGF
jgi:8-oxo-dGTP pyrophosphatase MutT (NUDIX family)